MVERQTVNLRVVGSIPTESVTYLLSRRNLKRKECITIVLISRDEKDYLVAHGVREGRNGISHTIAKGRKRTYYLCESEWNIEKLNKYRKNKIVK